MKKKLGRPKADYLTVVQTRRLQASVRLLCEKGGITLGDIAGRGGRRRIDAVMLRQRAYMANGSPRKRSLTVAAAWWLFCSLMATSGRKGHGKPGEFIREAVRELGWLMDRWNRSPDRLYAMLDDAAKRKPVLYILPAQVLPIADEIVRIASKARSSQQTVTYKQRVGRDVVKFLNGLGMAIGDKNAQDAISDVARALHDYDSDAPVAKIRTADLNTTRQTLTTAARKAWGERPDQLTHLILAAGRSRTHTVP